MRNYNNEFSQLVERKLKESDAEDRNYLSAQINRTYRLINKPTDLETELLKKANVKIKVAQANLPGLPPNYLTERTLNPKDAAEYLAIEVSRLLGLCRSARAAAR